MTFFQEFMLCLRWRPRQAVEALYWHLTRRFVRARNTLGRDAHLSPYAYRQWISHVERPRVAALLADEVEVARAATPRFTVVLIDADGTRGELTSRSIGSVLAQTRNDWELLRREVCPDANPASAHDPKILTLGTNDLAHFTVAAAMAARGEWIVWLTAGDELPPWALSQYSASALARPDASILYGDQDTIDPDGKRHDPWFKPQWNAEMILAQDFVTPACALRTDLARKILGDFAETGATPYALLLAATAASEPAPVHIRQVMVHTGAAVMRDDQSERLIAVRRHLKSTACAVKPGPFGTVLVNWPLPADRPKISILIPTRDRIDLVRTCVDSLLAATNYDNYEVLIIDNGSVEPESAAYFASLAGSSRVRILRYPGPFNFSAINNFAARQASGTYLCFLNNDTEVIDGAWLCAMLRQAARLHVGAVGAMLLYEDGSMQHAGVVIGLGGAAGHAHRGLHADDPGYFAQAHVPHYASAVTAACLLVSKDKFLSVGGFDETGLAVAYNDVDLCLKLQQAGWSNVYEPQARLYHHESKSRGNDLAPAHRERYLAELAVLQNRWGTRTYLDPMHHPDLNRRDESYAIALEAGNA